MHKALEEVMCKLMPRWHCLFDLVSTYAWQQEKGALKKWLRKYPGYVAALVLILAVASFGWNLIAKEKKYVEDLRFQLSANSTDYEIQLEEKKQRLTAALSHLEDNPRPEAPGEKQLLIGKLAKLKWKYESKNNSQGESTPRHSIVEVRSAAQPLIERQKLFVTGKTAWHPIASGKGLEKQGVFLWRVIPAEIDSSRHPRDESNWGPYSVFSIYPSAYERIKTTKKIRIGSYNVEQARFESTDSERKRYCVKPSDGLSDSDSDILCDVLDSGSITEKFGKVEPVVKRYSNIDGELLKDLEEGELDIAFGGISSARYRRENKFNFVKYTAPNPFLFASDENRALKKEIEPKDIICAVQGTVYEYVLRDLEKTNPGRYSFEVCQNTFDAIDKLSKKHIQWMVMMGKQALEEINKSGDFPLHPNTTSELVNSVPEDGKYQIGGDAFAMIDEILFKDVCQALQTMPKDDRLQHVQCLSKLKE